MHERIVVQCPGCNVRLGIPGDQGPIRVQCPQCESEFRWEQSVPLVTDPAFDAPAPAPTKGWRMGRAAILVSLLVAAASVIVWASRANSPSDSPRRYDYARNRSGARAPGSAETVAAPTPPSRQPRWVTANYSDLIERQTITHSQKTVGDLLAQIRGEPDASSAAADLQPQLEPFSFVCNDLVTVDRPQVGMPYISAVASYPPGSAQPAWAALFREGHYQLFVGDGRARLFLKGASPEKLFDQRQGVVRHALLAALDASGSDRIETEVYAFENDYRQQTIRLDLEPTVLSLGRGDLQPRGRSLSLERLAALLQAGGALEAAEIGTDRGLTLYSKPISGTAETVGGAPESLADFAVVYRSVFHGEQNPPYISLDTHEDIRKAKVNFGGLLEDTRVGSVVLEADKLFKTLSTGLDPNLRVDLVPEIRKVVPDFVTEDARSFRERVSTERQQIRYWFYPDRIKTVTDGQIAAVEQCQFFASAERTLTGGSKTIGAAEKETIDHLNSHYTQYSAYFEAFRELSTVGRMMALANWLWGATGRGDVDLDGLLAVELPAVTTARFTKQLLAVSSEIRWQEGFSETHGPVTPLDLSDFLSGVDPEATSDQVLDLAGAYFAKRDMKQYWPTELLERRASLDSQDAEVKQKLATLEALGTRIERERAALDRTSESAVAAFNEMVDHHERMSLAYSRAVDSLNGAIDTWNRLSIGHRTMVSVGGGISLEPQSFAKPEVRPLSPKIQAVRAARTRTVRGLVLDGLVSSEAVTAPPLPAPRAGGVGGWTPAAAASSDGVIEARWTRVDSSSATVQGRPGDPVRSYLVTTPTYFARTSVQPALRTATTSSSAYPAQIVTVGEVAAGRTVMLRRGAKLTPSPQEPVWSR